MTDEGAPAPPPPEKKRSHGSTDSGSSKKKRVKPVDIDLPEAPVGGVFCVCAVYVCECVYSVFVSVNVMFVRTQVSVGIFLSVCQSICVTAVVYQSFYVRTSVCQCFCAKTCVSVSNFEYVCISLSALSICVRQQSCTSSNYSDACTFLDC